MAVDSQDRFILSESYVIVRYSPDTRQWHRESGYFRSLYKARKEFKRYLQNDGHYRLISNTRKVEMEHKKFKYKYENYNTPDKIKS